MSDAEFRSVVAGLAPGPVAALAPHAPLASVAVLGAGPVGLAMACEALAEGLDVRIWSPVAAEVPASVTVRGAHLVGTYRFGSSNAGPGPSVTVAAGVDTAIAGVEVVVVATPSLHHGAVAGLLAPHLRADQTVVLVPGRCFGAVEFRRELRRCGVESMPSLAELATPPYLASVPTAGRLDIRARLAHVVASHGAARLSTVWPMIQATGSVLDASFSDLLGVLNVAPVVLNAGVADGGTVKRSTLLTATIAAVCDALDGERRRVAFAYGVRDLPSASASIAAAHGVEPGESLHETWHSIPAFDDLALPGLALRRLLGDDVACSLVPLASAGRSAGIPTPSIDAMVAAASLLTGTDYASLGRSFGALGLSGLTPEEVRRTCV